MPTVPAALPDVQQGGPAAPSLQANASPATFGANIASQALSETAQSTGQASDELFRRSMQLQALNNKAEGDNAYQKYVTQTNEVLRGYHNLAGKAAMDAYEPTMQQLATIRDNISAGMSNPMSRAGFDQDSRRQFAIMEESASVYAGQQGKQYRVQSAQGAMAAATENAIQNYKNPNAFLNADIEIRNQVQAIAAETGQPPAYADLEYQKAMGTVGAGVVQQMALIDHQPIQARDWFLKNQGLFDPLTRAKLDHDTHTWVQPVEAAQDANDTINSYVASHAAAVGVASTSTPTPNLAEIKTAGGQTAQVRADLAPRFQGFLNDLEKEYAVHSIGGYANRDVAGTNQPSFHAQGASIDINPNTNHGTVTDLPADTAALAAKWGLGWGANWQHNKDSMHFSAAEAEGGSTPIARGNASSNTPPALQELHMWEAGAADIIQSARDRALARYPEDPSYADKVAQIAQGQVMQHISDLRMQQQDARQTVQTALNGDPHTPNSGPTTYDQLAADPKVASALTQLDGTDMEGVLNQLRQKADPTLRMASEAIQNQYYKLRQESVLDPQAFIREPIGNMGLPPTITNQLLLDQAKAQRGLPVNPEMTKALTLGNQLGIMQSAGITKADTPELYQQYNAKLFESIQTYLDYYGKQPPANELQTIMRNLLVKDGPGGAPEFQRGSAVGVVRGVPNADVENILGEFRRRGVAMPPEEHIRGVYNNPSYKRVAQ